MLEINSQTSMCKNLILFSQTVTVHPELVEGCEPKMFILREPQDERLKWTALWLHRLKTMTQIQSNPSTKDICVIIFWNLR